MKIDKKGLEKVVQRFMKRKEIFVMELSKGEVRKILLEHAKNNEGCINCIYSGPKQGSISWKRRRCVLQLYYPGCNMFKPIVEVKRK